jgi:hypothetical protein
MSRHKMSLNSAYSLVKKKRPIISPNPTFMRILEQFEYELYHNYAKQPPLQQQTAQCQPSPQQQAPPPLPSQPPQPQQPQQSQQHIYRNPKIYSTSKQISGNTSANKLNIASKTSRARSTSNINRSSDYVSNTIKQNSYKFIETGQKRSKFSMDDLYDNVNPTLINKKRHLINQPVSVKQKLKSNPLNPYILSDVN